MNNKTLLPLSPLVQKVVIGGLYEHYKKLPYKVIAVARHSETLEELVVYQALYGEQGIWVRPLAMFLETISTGGEEKPRFRHVG